MTFVIKYLNILCFVLVVIGLQNSAFSQIKTDTLKVGYTNAPPFLIKKNNALEGVNIWLWETVAKDLGLTYELVEMDFTKMLKALEEGAIDVSINPLTITNSRNKVFDFTHSYFASHSTIAIHQRSTISKFKQFITSFINTNFLRGFLILIFIIIFFGILAWQFEKRKNPSQFRTGFKGFWDGLWWSVVTMTTVGYGDKSPKSLGGKIVALVWMFTGLLFISGLTASVASGLTLNQMKTTETEFNSFKTKPVGCVSNTSVVGYLKSHFFKDIVLYNNTSEGLHALNLDKIDAFLYDEPILKYRIKNNEEYSEIKLLSYKFDVQFYAFGVSKSKPQLTNILSQQLLEIMESYEWNVILNEYDLSGL